MILLGTRLEAPEDGHHDDSDEDDDDDLPPSLSPDIGPRHQPCPPLALAAPRRNTAVCYCQRRQQRLNVYTSHYVYPNLFYH